MTESLSNKWLKQMQAVIKRPKLLKRGSTIAAVAFSSRVTRVDMRDIRKSITLLENWGLKVIIAKHLSDQVEYNMLTSPETMLAEMLILAKNNIDGFYSVKGGFDANRLFQYNSFDRLLKIMYRKRIALIGFSDATTMQTPLIYNKLSSFYAPNLTYLYKRSQQTKDFLHKALFFNKPFAKIGNLEVINAAGVRQVNGILIAGNLMTMHDCFASGYNPMNKYSDVILAVEETEESDENVRRFLATITSYASVKAAIVNFKRTGGVDFKKGDMKRMIKRISAEDIPVLWYPDFGHVLDKRFFRTLGTGWPVKLALKRDKTASLEFLELK